MLKVRFLEDCYFLDERKLYNKDEIVDLKKERANRLYKKGTVDILKEKPKKEVIKKDVNTQEKIEENISENHNETDELSDLTVNELKNIARERGIDGFSTMNKQELIESLK